MINNKEKEIRKLKEILENCIEQDFCDYVCYEASAENLINAGYGDIKQVVNDLWNQVKEVLEKYFWCDKPKIEAFHDTSTNDYICLDADINNIFMKFLGIN